MDPRSPSPRRLLVGRLLLGLVVGSLIVTIPSNMSGQGSATGWKVVAWNNLGMHCMDADYSRLLDPAALQHDPGAGHRSCGRAGHAARGCQRHLRGRGRSERARSTRPRSARPTTGSTCCRSSAPTFRSTRARRNYDMPGASQRPAADGVRRGVGLVQRRGHPAHAVRRRRRQEPLPDDAGDARPAPTGAVLATTDVVLPVSDEMDLPGRATARAAGGCASPPPAGCTTANTERDYRLNILRLHDDRQAGDPTLRRRARRAPATAAAACIATATAGKPILCARCHASNALPGTGSARDLGR